MTRFNDKSIVLTGAAAGIGAATARRLASEGARLLLVDRSEAVAEIAGETGAVPLVCDLAADGGPARVAAEATALFGRIDVLVNNAGIGGSRPIAETTDELFDTVVGINLRSVFRLTRELLPHLARPGGAIVNISSTLGLAGHPNTSAYAVSKGGIAQMTRQMAAELGPDGIRVNAVAPGVVETQMTRERVHNDDFYQRAFIQAAPTRQHGVPDDIAAAIAFLASDEARFISAQVLAVDGGWLGARHPPRQR